MTQGPQGPQGREGPTGPRGGISLITAGALILVGMAVAAGWIVTHNNAATGGCGLSAPAFCDTFDAPSGTDPNARNGGQVADIWGASRLDGNWNYGLNGNIPADHNACANGALTPPDKDIYICNGRMIEAIDAAGVDVLAMYPKQPFDFAGRTGKIVFDVSNDNHGSHSFWPEIWVTDQPIPAPFVHLGTFQSNPRNGFGLRFSDINTGGVENAVIISNYVAYDSQDGLNGPTFAVNQFGSVVIANGIGQMNHYEVSVSQSMIDVWGTDAVNVGSSFGPLKHLTSITNAGLTFTRGLVWLEHGTYDANKFGVSDDHSFAWDNFGFDGPVLYHDVTYEEPDSAILQSGDQNCRQPCYSLGYDTNGSTHVVTFNVNSSYLANATSTYLLANFIEYGTGHNYSVNGSAYQPVVFPYPANWGINTFAIPLDKTLLHSGDNTFGFSGGVAITNVTLLLVAAIPAAGGTPQPTATVSSTQTPVNTATVGPSATPVPTAIPGACQFLSRAPAGTAFCDTFSVAQSGGRGGDLDEAKWSVARSAGVANANIDWPTTPAQACKSGVTSVTADNDIMVCDAASGHGGQLLTSHNIQGYGVMSMRPRQAFDFTGRTGVITLNVDAITEGSGIWWPSVYVTEEPAPAANDMGQVTGFRPKNGIGVNFDNTCNTTGQTGFDVFTFSNYAESRVINNNSTCFTAQRGVLNHIEIDLSQTQISIWASDAGGANFRQIASAPISLSFSKGYVHFQADSRAPDKYGGSVFRTAYYWDALGFDGPTGTPVENGYSAPDSLTTTSDGVNIGYPLLTNPYVVPALNVQGVNTSGMTSAQLSFEIAFIWANGSTPQNLVVHYSLNGGALHDAVMPDMTAATDCGNCPGPPPENWGVPFVTPIIASELVSGTNTIRIFTDNSTNSFPPVLANVDLLVFAGGPAPTPTPVLTTTPTPILSPTAGPSLTPTLTPTIGPSATHVPGTPTKTPKPTRTPRGNK